MPKNDYQPAQGSIPARVIAFFQANPDEELTLEDIAEKFDVVRNNIHTNLSLAISAGALVRDRNDDGEYVYRIGGTAQQAPKDKPGPKPGNSGKTGSDLLNAFGTAAKTPTRGYTSPRKDIDLTTITVDEGVPFMATHARGQSKWQPLFNKLTKTGQSIALPADLRGAVGAAANKINGLKTQGKYRVAMVDANTCRVWRVA